MKHLLFISLLLFVFHTTDANATNWYVKPSGGSGSGTSWTAAWNGLNSINWTSVQCGDTVWVAGGAYSSSLTPGRSCTVGSQLYIRRARSDASECTGAAGWSSGYDSTVAQTNAGIHSTGRNYFTISGRTTASGGSPGWTITDQSAGAFVIQFDGSASNNVLIEYINLVGGMNTVTNESRGLNIGYGGAGGSHITFSHMDISGFCSAGYVINVPYFTFEYGAIHDMSPTDAGPNCHPNTLYIVGSNYGVIKYSKFYNNESDGFLFNSSATDWKIYGNLLYNLGGGYYSKGIEISSNSTVSPMRIFNNTFYNNWADMQIDSGSGCGSGSETRNNLVYSSNQLINCGTMSNNLTISSPNPFVNLSGNDFHIVSTTGANYPGNAGINESTYFTTDMDGVVFGSDGIWDIGAYEFGSTVIAVKPSPPYLH